MENTTQPVTPDITPVVPVVKTPSGQDSLSKADLITWAKETLIFSMPAILAFLLAIQGGLNWKIALGMGASAFLASLINLLKKYSAGTK